MIAMFFIGYVAKCAGVTGWFWAFYWIWTTITVLAEIVHITSK